MPQNSTADRQPSSDADVCVVGSGVAGALVAYTLSRRGHDVVILEAGQRFDPGNRLEQMEQSLRPHGSLLDIWNMGGPRDQYVTSGGAYYPLNQTRVKAVGGTTLHWLGITPRLHQKDFEMNTRYGLATDWPIDYEDLRPYYAAAEQEMGVAGTQDNPFAPPRETDYPMEAFPASYSDTLFADACDELGITMHSTPQARNSEAYDGRSQCVGFSTCIPVCPSGAKYSADVHVRKAEAEGARVIDRAPVQRIEHDSSGESVDAAVYATPSGDTYRQGADAFVLACGAVETPRLLLLSESPQYPDGLANSSGAVGRYFMDQPIVSVTGELDQPTNQEPIGYHTRESHQFYDHEDPQPGSIKLVFENVNPESVVRPMLSGGDMTPRENVFDFAMGDSWGDEVLDKIESNYPNNRVRLLANPELLPRRENRVTLDESKTDDFGNPVPDVSWNIGSHARETMEFIREIQYDIFDELGATVVSETDLADPPPASHKMGTTRMGTNPAESVVTPQLRTHDLENLYIASSSVFVTGGAMNPTLTIAALALKAGEHIDNAL